MPTIQTFQGFGSPTVKYDLISGSQVKNATDGQMVVRPCKITGIGVVPGMNSGTVLTKCIPFLPALFSHHPDTDNFPDATLREQTVRSVPSAYQALVDLIYRGPGPSDWIMEDITQSDMMETFATATLPEDRGGTRGKALKLWYKQGYDNSVSYNVPPAGSDQRAGSVMKYVPKRIMRVKGVQTKAYWYAAKDAIREALGRINAVQWGSSTLNKRGTWLFAGLSTMTNDFGRTFNIELFFMNNPYRWFAVRAYLNIHGEHPPDSTSEALVRAGAAGVLEGSYLLFNGMGIYSIYVETDFENLFNFEPT